MSPPRSQTAAPGGSPLAAAPRLRALDAFRGLAVAAMILVNNPGSWSHVYPPLLHAEWHGCTPTDLVFPSFLFAVGTAMAFSLGRHAETRRAPAKTYRRIGRRVLVLLGLGLFLNGFPRYNWADLRFPGVLQRIGLAYGLAAIAVLNLSRKHQAIAAVLVLLGYWALLGFVPVPGVGAPDLSPEGNWVGYLDRQILGAAHLYQGGPFDPEGLLSTLPATVAVLAGYWAGQWLKGQWLRGTPRSGTSARLAIAGAATAIVGWVWGLGFPINKQLWTSSYVLFTAGWAAIVLALCYELVEVRRWRRLGRVFEIFGLNAIAVFVGSGLVARILYRTQVGAGDDAPSTYTWLYETFFAPWAGPVNGSLLFAIATVVLWWLVAYGLYRRGWFFKV